MGHTLVCWKCGASLADLTLPLRRLEVCRKCNAELHVCRMCVEYDTSKAKHCREPIADEVKDTEHANFCDYYQPREGAYLPPNAAEVAKSQSALDVLFGGKGGAASPGPTATNTGAQAAPQSANEDARRKLEDLFKSGPKK